MIITRLPLGPSSTLLMPLVILVLAVMISLSACTTTPAVDVQTVCPPIVTYTAAEQANLKAAYDALPAGSILRRAVMDYESLRDSIRACQGKSTR